jgi:hypothetical protein
MLRMVNHNRSACARDYREEFSNSLLEKGNEDVVVLPEYMPNDSTRELGEDRHRASQRAALQASPAERKNQVMPQE